jgi:hypothetical protein
MRFSAVAVAAMLALAFAAPAAAGSNAARGSPVRSSLTNSASATKATTKGATGAVPAASQVSTSEAPVSVPASNVPPVGRKLSADRVLAIAEALPKMKAVRAKYPASYGGAYLKGPFRWQVSFFSKKGAKEIGQVIIDDATGRVLEQWTGPQVAWTMARGYPGAFGEHAGALYIWLPLCVLFFVPFFDWRRPLRLLHLDLLALLSFSVSLAFFNHAHIYASVPLAYPPLLYLLARMLALLRRGARPQPPRLLIPAPWLAIGVVFLIGFRIGLNVTDGNVIDVGYAGVIGAQRIIDGRPLYGSFPSNNEHGDTYGPANYEAYIPFEQLFGWSGTWDDLPAAHAAAVVFDLLAVALLFLIGRRVRGPSLGIVLAYAWVSYPFTLFVLESDSNDALVAVLVLAALLCATYRPRAADAGRGAFTALAGLTKFAPLALAPLLATHGLWDRPARPHSGGKAGEEGLAAGGLGSVRTAGPGSVLSFFGFVRACMRARTFKAFCIAFILTAGVVSIPALRHDSLHTIYERTIAYQANRGSPFSVWGLYGGLHGLQTAVQIAAVLLAVALAVAPRRGDIMGLAAACAAVLIALQLGIEHWFYLYIPWFFPLAAIALLGGREEPSADDVDDSGSAADIAGADVDKHHDSKIFAAMMPTCARPLRWTPM